MLYIPMFAARLHINRMRNLIENYPLACNRATLWLVNQD